MDNLIHKNSFDEAVQSLSNAVRDLLIYLPSGVKATTGEVRLRQDKPLSIGVGNKIYFITKEARLSEEITGDCYIVTKKDISDSIRIMCKYSVHSYQNQIREGYIAVKGGHRTGLSGTAVHSGDTISTVREITSLNLRIGRHIDGCSSELTYKLFKDKLCGVLIAGVPSSGKTTLLRDIAMRLSTGVMGSCYKVSIVDERGEIGGVFEKEQGSNIKLCADLLTGYKKSDGIINALRSLSPHVIICDEIGTMEDIKALEAGVNSGVPVITTIHAGSIDEILNRPQGRKLLCTGAFQKLVILEGADKPCKIKSIIDLSEMNDKAYRNNPDNYILQYERNDAVTEAFV